MLNQILNRTMVIIRNQIDLSWTQYFPNLPLIGWMILITIGLGIASGMNSREFISQFNAGWGIAIGEFALILIPSFTLAAALERQRIDGPPVLLLGMAPFAGAGMVCPDTAYAALSPMIKHNRLSLAFSTYGGFKLLFPAGPLIIATSLGVVDGQLLPYCILVFIPVWAVGLLYARFIEGRTKNIQPEEQTNGGAGSLVFLWPFAILATLLTAGVLFDLSFNSIADFSTNPKGALFITAATALAMVAPSNRRECIEAGVRRAGSLLLIIGAASAFSTFLTTLLPVEAIFVARDGFTTILSLFLLTALFKILQGSSMSTFAAVGPVAAPIVEASQVSPILAVIAICLGSFVAILPNDSFYWLVRGNALQDKTEFQSIMILGGGALLQAIIGMTFIFVIHIFGLV